MSVFPFKGTMYLSAMYRRVILILDLILQIWKLRHELTLVQNNTYLTERIIVVDDYQSPLRHCIKRLIEIIFQGSGLNIRKTFLEESVVKPPFLRNI